MHVVRGVLRLGPAAVRVGCSAHKASHKSRDVDTCRRCRRIQSYAASPNFDTLCRYKLERWRLDLVAPLMPAVAVMTGEQLEPWPWTAPFDEVPCFIRLP